MRHARFTMIVAVVSVGALVVGSAGIDGAAAATVDGTARQATGGGAGAVNVCPSECEAALRRHRGSAPRKAVRKAKRRAKRRWRAGRVRATDSYRSKRKRRWVLVNGTAGAGTRSHLWSAWLRKRHGRWHMYRFADHAGADPSGVPCDIRPAYSEPHC